MFTYDTLSQAIQDYTENPETTFISQIPTFIKFSEERILKATQLLDFQDTVKLFWEDGDRCADKPCDWLATYTLTFSADDDYSERWELLSKDKSFLDEFWPDYAQKGTPRYYTDYGTTQFAVAPTPDRDCIASLHYLRRPDSLVDVLSGEQTWISTNAPQALLYGALVEASIFMKGEGERTQDYERRFSESILRLKNHGEALEPDDSLRRGMIHTERT